MKSTTLDTTSKISWQSFSTMKRFVSEAERLENASWRLWQMQQQKVKGAIEFNDRVDHENTNSNHVPLLNVQTNTHEMESIHSIDSEAEEGLPPLCIYCDQASGALRCNGCCHDAYCVPCFKMVHKKGHLATHTAVKIEAVFSEYSYALHQHLQHQRDSEGSVASNTSSNASSSTPSVHHDKKTISPSTSPTIGQLASSLHESKANSLQTSGKQKPWEYQMDLLLQRLMSGTISKEKELSVHNLDSLICKPKILRQQSNSSDTQKVLRVHDVSEQARHHYGRRKSITLPTSKSSVDLRKGTYNHEYDWDAEERQRTNEMVVAAALAAAGTQPFKRSISYSGLSNLSTTSTGVSTFASHDYSTTSSSPGSYSSSLPISSMQMTATTPAWASPNFRTNLVLSKPQKRQPRKLCGNCGGDHITIDCPKLENDLRQTVTELSETGHLQSSKKLLSRVEPYVRRSSGELADESSEETEDESDHDKKFEKNQDAANLRSRSNTALRKCFTTIHNDNTSNSTHSFLGDEMSVRGGTVKKIVRSSSFDSLSTSPLSSSPHLYSMNPIAEDRDLHAMPILTYCGASEDLQKWDPRSWFSSCVGNNLPPDVYRYLRYQLDDKLAKNTQYFHSGWVSLRPSSSAPWTRRYMILCRNNLWEYVDDLPTTHPLGYANLSEGSACLLPDSDSKILNLSTSEPGQATILREVLMSYYRDSVPKQAERAMCYIRCEDPRDAKVWSEKLAEVANLELSDLYDLSPNTNTGGSDSKQMNGDSLELGKGRFSVVRRAARKVSPGSETGDDNENIECALKIIDKEIFWDLVQQDVERECTVVREILTQTVLTVRSASQNLISRPVSPAKSSKQQMSQFRIPYCPLIPLLSIFETRSSIVMELELMHHGDLHEELVSSSAIEEPRAAFLIASLIKAIEFCQNNGVAHRDIKLSNLSVDSCTSSKGQKIPVIRIADFGMADFIQDDNGGTLRGRCGTPGFVAPEILTSGKGEAYPSQVDMFSAGVVAYTMLCGYEPFFGVTDDDLIRVNKLVEYDFDEPEWEAVTSQAKDLITKMMERSPHDRLTPQEALAHPFLKDAANALDDNGSTSLVKYLSSSFTIDIL